MVAQGFDIDGNQLPTTISLLGIVIFSPCGTLCNTQQLTQPPLALSVPLSRFTSRVGGGSAFYVRCHWEVMKQTSVKHECDVKEASPKVRWWRWWIWLGLVAVGVAVAAISPKCLLLVLCLACLLLFSHVPADLRWRYLNPMHFKNRSKRVRDDHDT